MSPLTPVVAPDLFAPFLVLALGLVVVLLAQQSRAALRRCQIADQAIRARDEVLATAVHDLRGPAARIALRADLLRADLLGQGDDPASRRRAEVLAQIAAAAMTMGSTIDELQDVVTLQPGQRPALAPEPVDLVAVARRSAEVHALGAGRSIDFRADQDELVGSWDPARVERILDNLIGNAVKYCPEGGEVAVAVGRETDGRRDWATLTVRDAGLGIAAEDLPHVFDWARRGRNVEGRVAGSGLGLAIVRQVVEQHGGMVAVTSRIGHGSTFTVRLPLDGPPGAAAGSAPVSGWPVGVAESHGPSAP